MSNELTGGCLCGAIRFRTGTPNVYPTLCHCTSCRRATGAHAVGLYTVARASAEFIVGNPTEFRSSADVLRGFCGRCGTSMRYWHARWPDREVRPEWPATLAFKRSNACLPRTKPRRWPISSWLTLKARAARKRSPASRFAQGSHLRAYQFQDLKSWWMRRNDMLQCRGSFFARLVPP